MRFNYRTMREIVVPQLSSATLSLMRERISAKLPGGALYAFDCCSESLGYDTGFRAIIIITEELIVSGISFDRVIELR